MKKLSPRGVYEIPKLEKHVVAEIRDMLNLNGIRNYPIVERIPYGKTTSYAGIPDLYCYFPKGHQTHKDSIWRDISSSMAISFWIEVKSLKGHLRPLQAKWLEEANYDGLIALMARSWGDVARDLEARGFVLKVRGL